MTKSYINLLKEGRTYYKSIGKCYCPVLNEYVFFNSKGFYHLKYDGLGHARSKKERMYRIGLIPLIKPVISRATKICKYMPKTYSRSFGKDVEYWMLQEIVGRQNTTVTVILRRVGSGNIIFWSVWKKRDKKTKNPSS